MTELRDGVVSDDEIDLSEVFWALASNWFLIAATAIVFGVAAIFYAVSVAEPVYEAEARLSFDSGSDGISLPSEFGGLAALAGVGQGGGGGPAATLEDRIKSRDFILEIAPEAGLFADPHINPPVGEPGLMLTVQVALGISEMPVASEAREIRQISEWINESVFVGLADNEVVTVRTEHPDPDRAALITNTIVNTALNRLLADQRRRSRAQIDYLAEELLAAQANLEEAAGALADYAVRADLASDQELARASAQLVLLREQRDESREQLDALNELQQLAEEGATLTAPIRSQLLRDYPMVREIEFRRLVDWSSDLQTWTIPAVAQIATAQAEVSSRRIEIGRTIDEFEQDARRNAAAAAELAALERDATVQQNIYEVIIRQFETQRITEGFEEAIADIFDMAVPPLAPSAPNKPLIVALGLVLGLFVGSCFALVRSMRGGVIHTAQTLADSVQSQIVARRVGRYLGRHKGEAGKLIRAFRENPNDQLDEVAVEIAQQRPKRLLVLPTCSEKVASALGLYLVVSDPDKSCALVDLTSTLSLTGDASSGEDNGLTRFDLDGGVTVLLPSKHQTISPLTIEGAVSKLEDAFDRVVVICPRLGTGAPIPSALASGAQRFISILRAGKTTKVQTDRIKALLKRSTTAQGSLVLE